jgi:hypothetical protein
MVESINRSIMTSEYKMYPIFLSSLCRELYDLRKNIYEDIGGCSLVYVDEQVKWRDIKQQEDIEEETGGRP